MSQNLSLVGCHKVLTGLTATRHNFAAILKNLMPLNSSQISTLPGEAQILNFFHNF